VQPPAPPPPRVAFVNGGILGLAGYAEWLRNAFPDGSEIHAEHFILTQALTPSERVIRRVLCQRFWPDPAGYANLDLARFRQEFHAGFQTRRRLVARGLANFDVLHFHRQATAYASLDLMERVPSIVSIDCTQRCVMQDLTGRLERATLSLNLRRDRRIFRRAAAIVSTSEWAARQVRADDPAIDVPIHVLCPPVALERFDPAWPEERLKRAHDGAPPQLLFMGGDFPRKGGYDLLDAWVAGEFHRRAALTIVSDWPIEGNVPDGVHVVRGVQRLTQEWLSVWRSADIFVMPTRNEAFGLVYQEAAAAGIPAIGSALNAVPEIIDHERTGLIVRPRDRAGLIAALERLIASPALRHQMGRASRAAVARVASPEAHRGALMAVIHAVRDAGPPAKRHTS
jgi:glycosyltransferase involved in cell wall biosynthesis